VLIDIVVASVTWFLLYRFGFGLSPKENQESNILYLLSVDASLSGFVIAALTILVTVKANNQSKPVDEMRSSTDFLFSSPLYKTLIKVFLGCIAEFIFIVFGLFLINFYYKNGFSTRVEGLFIGALFMSVMTSLRTIGILAMVVLLQAQK
jgi:uncharacterized membrane protein